ncbi:TPA: hypothetical protein I8Z82_001303 [Legionella pneumophila]|nr:hypothetical protein [Legionella pneumophila]HAT1987398.1 hypothetical protein [Legionella pneumophila]
MPISYDRWQSYPWKNELDMQNKRVIKHYEEVLLDEKFVGNTTPCIC